MLAPVARGCLSSIRATDESALLVVGQPDANDTRCARCGSLLFSVVRDGAYVHVALGSLRDAPALRPTAHIMVAFKAPWFDITDALPSTRAT